MRKNRKLASFLLAIMFFISQVAFNSISVKASIVSDKLTFNRTVSNSKGDVGTSVTELNAKAGELLTLNYSMGASDIPDTLNTTSKNKKVVLVIDTSGSMLDKDLGGKTRIAVAKEAAINFVNKVSEKQEIGSNIDIAIVPYKSYEYGVTDFKNSYSGRQTLINAINNIACTSDNYSGTNIGDGLRRAYHMLQQFSDSDYSKHLVLMTDGEPTAWSYIKSYDTGSSSYYTGSGQYTGNPYYTLYWSRRNKASYVASIDEVSNYDFEYDDDGGTDPLNYANKIGDLIGATKISSFLIGFTTSVNKNKLDTIAQNTKGKVSTATDASGLNSVYSSIADQIINDITVKDITFEESYASNIDVVSLPEGFTKTTNSSGVTTVSGKLANLNFNKVNNVFKLVSPIEFKIGIKFKDGTSGKHTLLSTSSKVNFTDYNNSFGSNSFNSLTVNVSQAINKLSKIPVDFTRNMLKTEYDLVNGTTEDITVSHKIKPQDIDYYSLLTEDYNKEKYVVVVADTSGSMAWDINGNQYSNNPSRLSVLKNTLTSNKGDGFIDKLANVKNLKIGLVGYSTKAVLGNSINSTTSDNITNGGQLQDFADMTNTNQVTALKAQVANLDADGATNIGDGLRRAYWLLSKVNSSADKYIVLMTDGEPTKYTYYSYKNEYYYGEDSATDSMLKGTGNSDQDSRALNYAKGMAGIVAENKVNSFIIGFSNGINAYKLQQIATSANGAYKEAQTASDLQQIYDNIAGDITKDIPIKNLTYETIVPEGLSVKAIVKDGKEYKNFTSTPVSGGTRISFNLEAITKIDYRLDEQSGIFKAPEINFDLVLNASKIGTYTLEKSNASNYTKVSYTDLPTATEKEPITNLFSSNAVTFTVRDGNSVVHKHGLYLNKTNDISSENFQLSTENKIAARNDNIYTAGVVFAINRVPSSLNINIAARDTSKLSNTNDINVVVRKVNSDDTLGDIVNNAGVNKSFNEGDGTANISVLFASTGKYLVTYTFQMEATDSNYADFKNTASVGTSSKDLQFEIKSQIDKHGLFLNNTNNVSDDNFKFSNINKIAAMNGQTYKAGVVVELNRTSSTLNIDIAARNVSKIKNEQDINVEVKKVTSDDTLGDIVNDAEVIKKLNLDDGTANIKVNFNATGKYLVTYTFQMEALSSNSDEFINNASIDESSKPVKFQIRSEIEKHGVLSKDATNIADSNFQFSNEKNIEAENGTNYTAGVVLNLSKTSSVMNITIDLRDPTEILNTEDIKVSIRKVLSNGTIGEAVNNSTITPVLNDVGGTNIRISFNDIGKYLVTYEFRMVAIKDKYNGFTNTAAIESSTKDLKFNIKSQIVKHGLFLNGNTNLSQSNFITSEVDNISANNGTIYTAGVILDLKRTSSLLDIDIAARDTSVIKDHGDINITINKLQDDDTLGDIVDNADSTVNLKGDGTTNISIIFSDAGRYVITYTFKMQAISSNFDGFVSRATVESSSKDLKFDNSSKIEKHGLFIYNNSDLTEGNFLINNPDNLAARNNTNYSAGVIVDLKRTASPLNITIASRDKSKLHGVDDIKVTINKIKNDGTVGEVISNASVNIKPNTDGTTSIKVTFSEIGKYLVTYTFEMQAISSNYDGFTSTANVENSSKELKFTIGSQVDKHGLFLNETNDVSDNNFRNNVSAMNNNIYTAGVVLDLMRTTSVLDIKIATRDASKLQATQDINVVVRKVSGNGSIGDVVKNSTVDKVLNSDGTADIKVKFDQVGKYLVIYTFEMQAAIGSSSVFTNTATLEKSSENFRLNITSELPDLF